VNVDCSQIKVPVLVQRSPSECGVSSVISNPQQRSGLGPSRAVASQEKDVINRVTPMITTVVPIPRTRDVEISTAELDSFSTSLRTK
jgi:hypothetical protein